MAGTDDNIITARGLLSTLADSLEAGLKLSELLTAVLDGPVATSLANDVKLFQESTLVPLLSDLNDFAVGIKGNKVCLGDCERLALAGKLSRQRQYNLQWERRRCDQTESCHRAWEDRRHH